MSAAAIGTLIVIAITIAAGMTWWCLLQIYKQLIRIERVLMEFHISCMVQNAPTKELAQAVLDKRYGVGAISPEKLGRMN